MVGLYVRGDFFTCPNPLSFDPYSKCPFDCKYCFIKQMEHTILKPVASKPMNYANLKDLERLLKQSKSTKSSKNPAVNALKHLPVIIGRKCEPLLNKDNHTLKAVKLFHKYDIKTIIETKNVIDITKYLDYVDGFNISVMPGKHHTVLEPGLPDINTRLKMAKQIKDAGLYVGIVGEPIMPTLNSSEEDIEMWMTNITNHLEPNHVNFGELRYHSVKVCDERMSSAGIDLIPIVKGMENWVDIGDMIFYASKVHGLKMSTPDWVNFSDRNDCFSCCGLDDFGVHNFNFQFAKHCVNKHGSIDWYHMLKQNFFGSVIFLNKFSDAFNMNNEKYYNLTDSGCIASRGVDRFITYKKGVKKTLKEAFE